MGMTAQPGLLNAPRSLLLSKCPLAFSERRFVFLTWCCVAILAFLSLLPAQEMVRTGFPGQLEHFVAYAGSAAIAMSGYGLNRKAPWVIGYFWLCAGILEYLQNFSPGRHRAVRISQRRHWERCVVGSHSSSSGVAAPLYRDGVTPRSGHRTGLRDQRREGACCGTLTLH